MGLVSEFIVGEDCGVMLILRPLLPFAPDQIRIAPDGQDGTRLEISGAGKVTGFPIDQPTQDSLLSWGQLHLIEFAQGASESSREILLDLEG